MNRKHFSTLFFAAIAVVLAVALLVPGQTGRDAADAAGPLLPDIGQRVNEVTGVKVTVAGDRTVATLRRDEDRWRIEELGGFPADFGKLRELLAGLAQAEILEHKTDNPEYYDRLGVEDVAQPDAGGVQVELSWDGDAVGVIVGDDASGRGGQYVRLAGAARSVLIDRELDVPSEAIDWADREILDVGSFSVKEVEIIHPDGDWVLARKASATDTDFALENIPDGREKLSAWSVNSLANAFSGLRMDSVLPAAGQEAGDAVKIRLQTFDGLEYLAEAWTGEERNWIRLQASVPAVPDAQEGDEEAAAKEQENAEKAAAVNDRVGDWVFEIGDSKYAALTKRMEDLLKQPEEAEDGDG